MTDGRLGPRPVLFSRVDGNGAAVLLLNGIAMTVPSWEFIARGLARDFRVVRCDFRGQLLSPGPVPKRVVDHVGDVVGLLDSLALNSVHIVGTSFGGVAGSLVAVHEAMKLPKRIVRVHDVAQTRQYILVQQAVRIHRAARLRGQA